MPALAYSFAAAWSAPDREFGRRIDAQHRKTVMAGDGRGVDDLALLLARLELGRRRLDAPEHALDVDLEDAIHLFRQNVRDRIDPGNAGHY